MRETVLGCFKLSYASLIKIMVAIQKCDFVRFCRVLFAFHEETGADIYIEPNDVLRTVIL